MSQKAVEGILGRMITDRGFRSWFYQEPEAACRRECLDVTSRELAALLALDEQYIEDLTRQLDPKIVRASIERAGETTRRTAERAVRQSARVGGGK